MVKIQRHWRVAIAMVGLVSVIFGCQSNSVPNSAHPLPTIQSASKQTSDFLTSDSGASPNLGQPGLYVADATDNTIYVLPTTANGSSVTPLAVISGPQTGLDHPTGVAVDGTGKVYVTNQGSSGNYTLETFASGAFGNVLPLRTINILPAHPFPSQEIPFGLVVRGKAIYVSVNDDVYIYWNEELGNDRPINFLCDNVNGCSNLVTGVNTALDSSGRIYTANNSQCVVVYSGISNGNPTELECLSPGSNSQPDSVALDKANNIYAPFDGQNPGSVAVFPPYGQGNTPTSYIPEGGYLSVRTSGAAFVSHAPTNSIDVWTLSGTTWTMTRQITGLAAGSPWHTGQIALH